MRTKQKLVMKVTDNLFKGFQEHGLRTPNEGINQRNLKILADVAVPKKWEWEWICGRAVKAISSPGVCSLCPGGWPGH